MATASAPLQVSTVPADPLTVEQRLGEIQKAVDHIKATGKTAQGRPTLSITDIEDALGDLFAVHGVLTPYTYTVDPIIHWPESKMPLWQVDITLRMISADSKNDYIECRLIDVGGSPSAAVSFALKRFYRALFHLSDEQDERREVMRSAPAPAPEATRAKVEPPPARHDPTIEPPDPENLDRLYRLTGSLPENPKTSQEIDNLLRSISWRALMERAEAAHLKQCGDACIHLSPAGAESGDLPF